MRIDFRLRESNAQCIVSARRADIEVQSIARNYLRKADTGAEAQLHCVRTPADPGVVINKFSHEIFRHEIRARNVEDDINVTR